MENQEKREMIERAFWPLYRQVNKEHYSETQHDFFEYFLEALAEEIAIEVEVEHTYDREGSYGTQFPMTIIKKGVWVLETFQGHQGDEGPARAIILPLGEKEDEG